MDKNEIEIAIATILHNMECVKGAEETVPEIDKKKFISEKIRLSKELNKYLEMEKKVNG